MLLDLVTGELDARLPARSHGLLTYSGVQVSADGRFVAQLIETSADPAAKVLVVHEVASGRRALPAHPAILRQRRRLNGRACAVAGGRTVIRRLPRRRQSARRHAAGLVPPEGTSRNRDTAALAFGPDGRL